MLIPARRRPGAPVFASECNRATCCRCGAACDAGRMRSRTGFSASCGCRLPTAITIAPDSADPWNAAAGTAQPMRSAAGSRAMVAAVPLGSTRPRRYASRRRNQTLAAAQATLSRPMPSSSAHVTLFPRSAARFRAPNYERRGILAHSWALRLFTLLLYRPSFSLHARLHGLAVRPPRCEEAHACRVQRAAGVRRTYPPSRKCRGLQSLASPRRAMQIANAGEHLDHEKIGKTCAWCQTSSYRGRPEPRLDILSAQSQLATIATWCRFASGPCVARHALARFRQAACKLGRPP